jgi:hypothetical protein
MVNALPAVFVVVTEDPSVAVVVLVVSDVVPNPVIAVPKYRSVGPLPAVVPATRTTPDAVRSRIEYGN